MALILGMSVGQDVYFNDVKVTLEQVMSPTRFVLMVHGAAMNQKFEVDSTGTTAILPEVMVHSSPTHRERWAKLVIEAPQHVSIKRGKVKRREEAGG